MKTQTSIKIFGIIIGIFVGLALVSSSAINYVFASEASRPDIVTLPASDITQDSARLRVQYTPNGSTTTVWFEYGEDDNDLDDYSESYTAAFSMGGTEWIEIENLDEDTVYYFRAIGTNSKGSDYGDVISFRTSPDPESTSSSSTSGSTGSSSSSSSNSSSNSSSSSSTSTSSSTSSNSGSAPVLVASNSNRPQIIEREEDRILISTNGMFNDYVEISLEDGRERVSRGDVVTYEISYRNLYEGSIDNVALVIDIPEYSSLVRYEGEGIVDSVEGSIFYDLETLREGEQDLFEIDILIGNEMDVEREMVVSAQLAYENPTTKANEDLTAIDVNDVGLSAVTASASGAGFLPLSILGWIIVALLLIAIFWLSRRYILMGNTQVVPAMATASAGYAAGASNDTRIEDVDALSHEEYLASIRAQYGTPAPVSLKESPTPENSYMNVANNTNQSPNNSQLGGLPFYEGDSNKS